VAASWFKDPGKTIPPLKELDKSSHGRSLSSTLGPCLDKYVSAFSCPKISQNLELSRAFNQAPKVGCARLDPVESSLRVWAGWLIK